MSTVKMPTAGAALALAGGLALLIAVIVLTAASPRARAATTGQLQQQISAGQGRVSSLSGALGQASARVGKLGASVSSLQRQVDRLQADLNVKRAELLKLQDELAAARKRLAQLEAAQVHTEAVLSQQLVGSYESDRPDLVSVVLDSTGFPNLLERLAFAQRVGHQDAQIVGQVKAARRAVAAEATHLGQLSVRQQRLTTAVLYERNSVDRTRISLVAQQIAAIHVRNSRAGQLSSARQSLSSLRGQLAQLQAAQAAAAARAAARARALTPTAPSGSSGSGSSSGSPAPAPAPGGSSGGFTFPLPTSAASPPGTWSLDDGVDISAPGGTPEYAVCSGTIVQHGIGGFGPSAPVIHCDGSLSGYDYVYYGHAGPGNWVPVGAHVSQGQAISEVGYGDVGISTGPHLEIGFADSSGAPVGPSSAPAMAALLHSAFGG
jgi:murein DD-endopeptidase MepM/ murein hydrolase activator NlpD